ncbi:tetratricopeptide repeat protein [Ferruginibacter sp.]
MKNFLTALTILVSAQSFAQTDSAAFFYQKGVEEKNAKRFLSASKNFDKAIKLNPQYTAAYIDNGYANLEMRKTDVAIASFTKANELEPANSVAIGELMSLYFSYRQYAKAIEFAQKCKDCANAEKNHCIKPIPAGRLCKGRKSIAGLSFKNTGRCGCELCTGPQLYGNGANAQCH